MAVIRITVPDDDEVTQKFFDVQGARSRSAAVRMLAQLFVAEYGYIDVVNVVGKRLVEQHTSTGNTAPPAPPTESNDADDSDTDNYVGSTDNTVSGVQPALGDTAEATSAATANSTTATNPQPVAKKQSEKQPVKKEAVAAAPDMEAIFSNARNS